MSVIEQTKRATLGGERVSANAYLGLTALVGLVGWAATAWVVHVAATPPSGVVGLREVGPWIQTVTQYSWSLLWLWTGLVAVQLLVSVRVERGAVLSIPNAVWTAGTVVALGLSFASVEFTVAALAWLPWLALFAVAYLVTGLLVTRGGVYLAAGGVSALLAAYGGYAVLTASGALVVSPDAATLAGQVLLPFPYAYAVLGALHVVPLAVDAARGGRQLTDEGIPQVEAEALDDGDRAGGVVPD